MDTFTQISTILSSRPPLEKFGHILEASLEINFAYTILLKLGKFSAGKTAAWVDQEKIRIIPPFVEDASINVALVSSRLDAFERGVEKVLKRLNGIAISWAISASAASTFFLFYLPYDAKDPIGIAKGLAWALFLLGATPTGVIAWTVVQFAARRRMLRYSQAFDLLLEARRTQNKENIRKIRERLIRKLQKDRDNNSNHD